MPHGLFGAALYLQFIETRGEDEAPTFLEGRSQRGLVCHRLRFGVDALVPNV
jgi:hypothetical protein